MEVAFVLLVEGEVEDADDIHGLEAVVPVSPLALFLDGKGGVVEASVLEELLFPALHLNQDLLAPLVLAIHVEHGLAVGLADAEVFRVEVRERTHLLFSLEQAVDEADEQVFVHLRSEKLLEPEVRIRVHVAVFVEYPVFH